MRIIHLPTTVGGNPQGLNRTMKAMGINSKCWALSKSPLKVGNDTDYFIYNDSDHFIVKEVKRLMALRYIFLFDLIFLNFGSTLYTPFPKYRFKNHKGIKFILLYIYSIYRSMIQQLEFFLLRMRKLKVFVQYQGTDARQIYYCQKNYSITVPSFSKPYRKREYQIDNYKRLEIKKLEKVSDQIYSLNPDLMNVLPKTAKFLPYCSIDPAHWNPVYVNRNEGPRPLKVGHAPSNRSIKGTEVVVNVINELRKNEVNIELLLVENIPNDKAVKLYEDVDILIDQLYLGWYGGLAVELMALGKPVLCFLREEDYKFIPKEMANEIPVINVNQQTLYNTLISIVEMPKSKLYNIGYKSRLYVEKWHNPQNIVKQIYNDI